MDQTHNFPISPLDQNLPEASRRREASAKVFKLHMQTTGERREICVHPGL